MNVPAVALNKKYVVKSCIIQWLGPAYDKHGRMGANPDYYNERDVDQLAESIIRSIEDPK